MLHAHQIPQIAPQTSQPQVASFARGSRYDCLTASSFLFPQKTANLHPPESFSVWCRFVTFEQDQSVEQVFRVGTMHELAGKRVEVKSATPRGSGPVAPANLPVGRVWGAQRPLNRSMGLYPGQIPQPGFGMGPYGPVG